MKWKNILKEELNEEKMCDMPHCRSKAKMKNPLASGKLCSTHFNMANNREPQKGIGLRHWVAIESEE